MHIHLEFVVLSLIFALVFVVGIKWILQSYKQVTMFEEYHTAARSLAILSFLFGAVLVFFVFIFIGSVTG